MHQLSRAKVPVFVFTSCIYLDPVDRMSCDARAVKAVISLCRSWVEGRGCCEGEECPFGTVANRAVDDPFTYVGRPKADRAVLRAGAEHLRPGCTIPSDACEVTVALTRIKVTEERAQLSIPDEDVASYTKLR